MNPRLISAFIFLSAALLSWSASAATLEYLDGTIIECKVLSKDDKFVTIETMMSGMTIKKTVLLATVHKVTINDKTYVITAKPATDTKANTEPTATAAAKPSIRKASAPATGEKTTRTKGEIEALIQSEGRAPPEWFESTPLNYPQTLDLDWPETPPEKGWNNQKNVGQYIWDIINPNPNKWREGIKLLHHLLSLHKNDVEKRNRDMEALGRMYFILHQDYARAAFWWRQAGVEKSLSPPGLSVHLAECYWRLGNKQMAVEHLRKMRNMPYDAIKLWADMGDTKQALALATATIKGGGNQLHYVYLYAGDACRVAGRYKDAIAYYEKVAAVPTDSNGHNIRNHERAKASIEAIKLFELSDVKNVDAGTYRADSIGYEGPVHVEVVVRNQRIDSVRVVQHKEKQFYAAMTDTPKKILARQSVQEVDATSGATITSEAIINATAKALAKGAK